MRRHTDDGSDINVWPAVTDTILLIASIFIVLAVSSMVMSSARRAEADVHRPGVEVEPPQEGQPLLASSYPLDEAELFRSGQHQVKDRTKARVELTLRLEAMTMEVPEIRMTALQKGEPFHLVIEIAGHTDKDPVVGEGVPRGGDGNWNLSSNRATTVMHEVESILRERPELRQSLGIQQDIHGNAVPESTILRAAAYSSHVPRKPLPTDRPVTQSEARSTKAVNRRIELNLFAEPAYVVRGPGEAAGMGKDRAGEIR